jgi:hypothetical protein
VLRALTAAPAGYKGETPFDVTFSTNIARELNGDPGAVQAVLRAVPGLPPINAALVIVNSSESAGTSEGDAAWLTLSSVGRTFVHELGHLGFGLADEYEYRTGASGEPVHTRTDTSEPANPNVTVQNTAATVKWRHLFQPPNVAIPSTIGGPCRLDHPVKAGVPSGAVGLFEGADQNSCGIFRSSEKCCMRAEADPFCVVCEQAISTRLAGGVNAGPARLFDAAAWTHAMTLAPLVIQPDDFDLVTYNAETGRIAMAFASDFQRSSATAISARGEMSIDPGFHSLASFALGDRRFLAAENILGQRKIFQVDADAIQAFPPGPAFVELFERPAAVPPVVGASHMLSLSLGPATVILRYDRITGGLELETFDPVQNRPVTIASTAAGSLVAWHPRLSSLTSVTIAGIPHVIGIDMIERRVFVARAAMPFGPTPMLMLTDTFASGLGFLMPFQTHAFGFTHANRPTLLTYSNLDGAVRLYDVRPDQSGIDFTFTWTLTPGAKALFDVGLPAFGFTHGPSGVGSDQVDDLWFYNTALQRFSVSRFR